VLLIRFLFLNSAVVFNLMKSSSEKAIEGLLDNLEKGRKKIWIANGSAEFLLVLFASLGLVSLFSYIYSNNVYFSILKILAILTLCLGFAKFFIPPIFKREERAKLALEIEKISPGLGEDTLNALLLASDLTKTQKGLGVSKFLTEAHVDEVASKLKSLDLSPVLPREKIKTHRKSLATILVLSVIMLIFAPREFQRFLFSTHILPSSEPNSLELADIKIEYKYPAYTKLASRVVNGSTGDVRAIKGTRVIFEATPLEPLAEGEIVIENHLPSPVGWDGRRIKSEFAILSDGDFFIQDKKKNLRSRIFKITSDEDKSPKVAIESPGGNIIEVGENENLDISYKAQDDFGLTKLLLIWKTKRGKEDKPIEGVRGEPKSIDGKFTWDLGSVQSEPDEIIEVKISAYDNDTVSGPKVGTSNVIKVKLNNPRRKHENAIASTERLLEEFLDILGDDIEHRSNESNVNVSGIKKVQEGIMTKIEKATGPLDEILEKMKSDDSSDYTYFLGLSNMKVRINDILGERRDLIGSFSVADFPHLGDLIKREISEFEDDILFLDSTLRGERLRESLVYGRDALDRYNELSELLKKLKQGGNEETKKEIEKKIEELKGLMSQLSQKLSSISRDTREGFLNPDSFKTLDLEGKLNEIMELINKGKTDEALNLLSSFEGSLREMVASLESGSQMLNSNMLAKQITELNELLERMKGLENREKSLKENTQNVKDSLLKNQSGRRNPIDFVEREKKKVERLKNLIMESEAKISGNIGAREFIEGSLLTRRIIDESDELKHLLDALEFNEALRGAKDIEEGTIGLRNLSYLGVGEVAKASREIEQSAELAGEIHRDIERFRGTEEKEGKTDELARRQDEIEKEASELSENLKGLSQDIPSPEIGEKISESRGFMRSASRSLNGKEISKAISSQEEALKSLAKAREEANELLSKYQMSARGMGLPVPLVLGRNQFQDGIGGVDTSHVNIPSAEEKVGKEFKETLLKALKDGSPEGYSELNKKYYERIIK